jgi:mannose-6-phosphate isomerase-like protein (cupin superfamily)
MDISMHVKPYDETIDEAPAFWLADSLWVLLASGEQTAGRYSLLWERCPQASGPGPHTHEQDEQLYVLDGELTVRAGNQLLEASAGSFLFIPRGTVHSFRVDSPTATLLISFTPAGYERLVTQLGMPAETRTLPPKGQPNAVTDPRHLATLFLQAGTRLVDEPDVLRPSGEWGDPAPVRDLRGGPLPN